jgi:hypothetical protein
MSRRASGFALTDARPPRRRRSAAWQTALAGMALCALALSALAAPVRAHEIPARVTVLAFVKPDADVLRVLVRVPLEAIRDIEFPLFGPGYLDIDAVRPLLGDAARMWIADYLEFSADGRVLELRAVAAARISLPSDPSFASWQTAIAHMAAPRLPAGTELPWQQALFDVLLEYPLHPVDARIAVESGLAHLGITTTTVMRLVTPDGAVRAFHYVGNAGVVQLDPRWHQAALRFVRLGFLHILEGIDHLLFLLCLVIPFRRIRPLIVLVTSFTVAHSITLAASALGFAPTALWFPPLIETLIAASIVYMAFENIVGPRLERRWLITFIFGLVHGFGFSFLLRDSLQFAGSHLATSLLAFNIGVELGQLLVLIVAVPALALLFRKVVAERIGTILLSALIAHSAWHWMTERGSELAAYDVAWPAFDAMFALGAVRMLLLVLLSALAALGVHQLARRFGGETRLGQPQLSGQPARETSAILSP